MEQKGIYSPVFIFGNPRSGTTIIQNILAGHSDLAWFSNYTSKILELPKVAFLSNLYSQVAQKPLSRWINKIIPRPVEGHLIFNRCGLSIQNLKSSHPKPINQNHLIKIIKLHLKYQKKPRFFNKNILTGRRLLNIYSIFPDAKFIHIIRNPKSQIASLLNFTQQNYHKTWNKGNYSPSDWETKIKPVFEMVIEKWNNLIISSKEGSTNIGEDYIEIFYEDFVVNPKREFQKILNHCELETYPKFEEFIDRFEIINMNTHYQDQFTQLHIDMIMNATRETVNLLQKSEDY